MEDSRAVMRSLVVVLALLLLHQATGSKQTDLITQASNEFAHSLYQELARENQGNLLVCPLSLHVALGLVHQGAGGNSATELARVLKLSDSKDNIKESYKSLLAGFQDETLKMATKLYPAVSFQLNSSYVALAQQYFLSDVEKLDFNNADSAANTINKYVESKTNNKIKNLISPDSLSGDTTLVLVNAVHFKATWKHTFPRAHDGDFRVGPTLDGKVQTKFLSHMDKFFLYKQDSALQAKVLKMEYEKGGYSMVFVLPDKEDGLHDLEVKLAGTTLEDILKGLEKTYVKVTIPKFKLEQTFDSLPNTLQQMGVREIFLPSADLKNIGNGGRNMYVSSVIQKTFINVDEQGTEAAAATAIRMTTKNMRIIQGTPAVFMANRPFLFYLVGQDKIVLFNGRLLNPSV